MKSSIKVWDDEDYHLISPLPSKVWHRNVISEIGHCRVCITQWQIFYNYYKELDRIKINGKWVNAYHERWECNKCRTIV